jgi:hypothetical protein
MRGDDTDQGRRAPPSVGSGLLRAEIEAAKANSGLSLKALTVLTEDLDPYRQDTPSGHRDARWFAAMVARFVRPQDRIHLRALHYAISGTTGIAMTNGQSYRNDEESWFWLGNGASKPARWLGYVPFSRLRDERNAPPDSYILEDYTRTGEGGVSLGGPTPPDLGAFSLPGIWAHPPKPPQPYRLILFGEKSSLRDELSPVASEFEAELLLPTGEISETLVYDLAQRIAADGRPAVIFYFADFDPSGHQMPVSVARKLQAHRTMFFPDIDVEVHRVALTLEQVRQYNLPSSVIKETEKRKGRWLARWNHEQTEIDALLGLHRGVVERLARDAVKPFYDATLYRRCQDVTDSWKEQAQSELIGEPGYRTACEVVRQAYRQIVAAVAEYRKQREEARSHLPNWTEEIEPPEPAIDYDAQPEPLFTTEDDFVTASVKLKADRNLEDGEGEPTPPPRMRLRRPTE